MNACAFSHCAGIPLILFVVMCTVREDFRKLVEGFKQFDTEHNSISYVSDHAVLVTAVSQAPRTSISGRMRRPSMITQAADLAWLASKVSNT